jgi:hypothetical protein
MSASDVKLQNEVSELKWLMSSDWNNHRSDLTYYHKPFPLRTHKRCKIEKSCMNSLPNSNHNLIQYNIHINSGEVRIDQEYPGLNFGIYLGQTRSRGLEQPLVKLYLPTGQGQTPNYRC